MPTITPTVVSAKGMVRLDLDFTDTDAPYAYVQRVDSATGATTAVRTHGATTTVGTLAEVNLYAGYKGVLYDAELPLDAPCYYTADAPSAVLNINKNFSDGYLDPWAVSPSTTTYLIKYGGDQSAISSEASTYYAQFAGNGSVASPQIQSELIPATPGASLTATAVYQSNSTPTAGITLQYLASDGTTVLGTTSSTGAIGSAFTLATRTVTATAPANTVYARLLVLMSGTPASTTYLQVFLAKVTNAAATATSAGVTVPSAGSCWLKDPLRPANNIRVDFCFDPNPGCTPTEGVFFQGLDVESLATNSALFNINNQAEPVVVNKTRSSATSTLTLVTRTFTDRDRVVSLLSPGTPLLWQVPDQYGMPDRYLAVGNASISRVLPDHRYPVRVASLPFAVVLAPGGPSQGVAGARWQDTCDLYATWAAVTSAGKTWTDVLDGVIG